MSDSNLYEVENILKRRIFKGKREYLIKWKGYPENESTWEPLSHLKYIQYMIKEFEDNLKKDREGKDEEKEEITEDKEEKKEEDKDKDNAKDNKEKEELNNKNESTNNNNSNNPEQKENEKDEGKENTESTKPKEEKSITNTKKKEVNKKIKTIKKNNKLLRRKRKPSSIKKKNLEVRISDNKAIFEVDLSLEKILSVKLDNKALIAIVEKRLKNGRLFKEIMSTEELKKTNPWILIDYYEGKIKFA